MTKKYTVELTEAQLRFLRHAIQDAPYPGDKTEIALARRVIEKVDEALKNSHNTAVRRG